MRILCLINFGDRRHCSRRTLAVLRERLERSGHSFRLKLSRSLDDSRRIIAAARRHGFDTLLIGGGDGTIHHALNACIGRGWTFGVLPMGTTNALARSLGVPLDPVRALDSALAGRVREIDVGEVGGRYFACFASVGWDAEIVHRFVGQSKVRFGRPGYVIEGLLSLGRIGRLPPVTLRSSDLGGEPMRATQIIVSNISNYAGLNVFNNDMTDGRMDVLAIRSGRPLSLVRCALQMLLHPRRRELERLFPDEVVKASVNSLTMRAETRMHLQLDGDPISIADDREYQLRVHRRAIAILIPPAQH
ncbi:MAG: lipid kinase [Candidatus Sumerlaeia bacterium]